MHPAPSVIIFTVTAGAGYGLLFWLALARLGALAPAISNTQLVVAGFIGLLLVTIGLLSSTLHLANPKNAWRSFMRFRTSYRCTGVYCDDLWQFENHSTMEQCSNSG